MSIQRIEEPELNRRIVLTFLEKLEVMTDEERRIILKSIELINSPLYYSFTTPMTESRLNLTGYMGKLRARPKQDVQPTLHQEWGRETAELFGEPKKTPLYALLYKQYDQAKLRECREWVLKTKAEKEGTNDPVRKPGALFMSNYKNFLNPKPYQPK